MGVALSMSGLGDIWEDIVESIEDLIVSGCYERVNNFMSLLQAGKLRRLAASMACRRGFALDLGAGPGYTSLEYCKSCSGPILLLDASTENLYRAKAILEKACPDAAVEVVSVFEALPLRDCSVSSIIATFSLRDAVDRDKAIEEAARVLAGDGRLVVLDIYRPSAKLATAALLSYFALMPLLGAILTGCPRHALDYVGLQKTLRRMDTVKGMALRMAKYFSFVRSLKIMPGTALWIAERPRGGCR